MFGKLGQYLFTNLTNLTRLTCTYLLLNMKVLLCLMLTKIVNILKIRRTLPSV